MCRNAPYFFIKSADSLGQYTLDRYEFKKAPKNPNTTWSLDMLHRWCYTRPVGLFRPVSRHRMGGKLKKFTTFFIPMVDF